MWFYRLAGLAAGMISLGIVLSTVPANAQNPPHAAAPDVIQPGKQLYSVYCTSCHGINGQGDGPSARSLLRRPRPFTQVLKEKKEADLIEVISTGKEQMPAWNRVLSERQIRDIYDYIRTMKRKKQP